VKGLSPRIAFASFKFRGISPNIFISPSGRESHTRSRLVVQSAAGAFKNGKKGLLVLGCLRDPLISMPDNSGRPQAYDCAGFCAGFEGNQTGCAAMLTIATL
jgi:hypothetical protein